MRIRKFVIPILIALSANTLFAQMPKSLQVKEYKLSNGLTVWLNEDHNQPQIFGAIVVKAGSKDCPNTGIAHYFEHMMFKGTDKIGTTDYQAEKQVLDSIAKKYDELAQTKNAQKRDTIQAEINELSIRAAKYVIPNEFNSLISKYGGSELNAGTTYDFTLYYNTFSPQYISQWAAINSERLINPVFRMFQSELETVYEEKNMYNDFMGAQAMEKWMERYFYPHPYAYPIIGSTEYLKNPQLSQMRIFFEEYYVASNMGLILSGNFNSEEVLPILESAFSRIRKGDVPTKDVTSLPPFNGKENIKLKFPIPIVKIMAMGFRGAPANHKDLPALNIAIKLLNNENGTGYLDRLAKDRKVMVAQAIALSMNEAGVIAVLAVPKLIFQTYSKAEKLVWNEIDRIKNGDFNDEDFQSLKLEQERSYKTSLENIKDRSMVMLTLYSQGKTWEEYLEEVRQVDALTKEDIMEVAKKYFNDNYLLATKKTGNYPKNKLTKPGFAPVTPQNTEAVSEFAKELEEIPVKEVAPRFIDFEKDVNTQKLNPLATLYVTNNPVNDIFTLNLSYGVGNLNNPIIPHLANYLPFLGTTSMDSNVFRKKLQTLGSTLTFEENERSFTIKISGFDNKFGETMRLVGDFIKNVQGDKKQLKQIVDGEKVVDKAFFKSSDEVAAALLEKTKYGENSRYLTKLSLSQVKKLKETELIELFNKVVKTECNLHYCGKQSIDQIAKEVNNHLHINEITTPADIVIREQVVYKKPIVYFFDDPKVSQSIIYTYSSGNVHNDHLSRNTSKLFTEYFGGDMSSLMFQEIREFRSFAYRVRAEYSLPLLSQSNKPGNFITMLSTQNDKTTDAIGVLDSLITEMPVKPEKIAINRQSITNRINNNYPTFRDISARIARWKEEGYSVDPNKQLLEDLTNIGMNEVEEFYKNDIKGHPVVYTIVGNKKQIDMKKLSDFGTIVYVKKKEIYR